MDRFDVQQQASASSFHTQNELIEGERDECLRMSIDQVEQLNEISNLVKNTQPVRKEKSRVGKKEYENSSRFDHTQEYQELKLF